MRKIELTKKNRQVIILYASTMIGALLGVISSIVNTRYLQPDQYGNVRYVENIINFIASLLLFGYFLSGSRLLALSKSEERSRKIRGCMIIILLIASVALFLGTGINYFFHISKPSVAKLFLISLPVCLNPLLSNYINTTAQGDNHIYRLSITRLVPSLIYVPLAYVLYCYTGATATKMILLQWGLPTLVFIIVIASTKPSFNNLRPAFHDLNKENKDYGFQLYIGSLVMVATNYLAGITLGMFNSDNSEVGFYTLALTVTSPLSTLPAIVGTTYFKEFARQTKIPDNVMKMTVLITVASCVIFIIIIQPLTNFLYSERYAKVGIYAIWLAVGSSIHGFGDMINRYLGSHGQGKSIRNSSIANGTFKIIGYTLFVYLWNTNGAIITTVICDLIYCFVLLVYYKRFVRLNYEQTV